MLHFPDGVPIYLRTGATDMRKSINGLAAIVQNDMSLNPFNPGYYVFCNKPRHLIKLLYWDNTGFALWYKRLEKHRFPWPQKACDVRKITNHQMQWLLEGIDLFCAHEKLHYSCL